MSDLYQFQFLAMGGQNELRLYADNKEYAREIAKNAIDEILRIEKTYSRYRPESLMSQINSLAGKSAVSIDAEAVHLFQVADYWHQTSNGLFDISSGVLRKIWDFASGIPPSDLKIKEYLKLVNWKSVYFSGQEIGIPNVGMELDLGGIAKEYAVDRATQILQEQGITSGLVNLGGDIRVLGPHLDGTPWAVQIAHPRVMGAVLATINIAQGALTTSGDYIRFMDVAGKRYSHILNPKTGYPVSYWQSATALAPLCLSAGHASTYAMLLESSAQDALDQLKIQYLLVGPTGEIIQNLA
jgi:thiamine biosynthesis lipoprotein